MIDLTLANLALRANVISANYLAQTPLLTVFDLRDIRRRNPGLTLVLTPAQEEEWRRSLFWGDRLVSTDERAGWAAALVPDAEAALDAAGGRMSVEALFELLCVAALAARQAATPDDTARAAALDRRVRAALGRDEFRLSPAAIQERLDRIIG